MTGPGGCEPAGLAKSQEEDHAGGTERATKTAFKGNV